MRSKRILLLALFAAAVFFTAPACELSGTATSGQSQPENTKRQLFSGIEYQRVVESSPRPMVIHIVTVDLKKNGVQAIVTPPTDANANRPLTARTTSEFLEDHGVQLAINGDSFSPWYDWGPLGYSPKSGESVKPNGIAAYQGTIYGEDSEEHTLYITRTGRATIDMPPDNIFQAISGNPRLLQAGNIVEFSNNDIEPRSAVGVTRSGEKLILVVVDGRQEGYSEGVTLAELAQILRDHRAWDAINLDGGGSSTLVMADKDGNPILLNSPIHQGRPGNERPVGNHIGIFAKDN